MLINLLIMIKNVCVIDTPYALSIYLLKMPIDEIKSTKFFVGDSVNTNIIYRLPHWVLIRNQSAKADWIYMSWLRIYKYLKCWSYPFAKLYAQDHLYIASQMIGPYNYTNIPDGPSCYTIWERCPFQPIKHTLPSIFQIKKWLKYILSRGKMYDLKYGVNEQCINRWITTRDDEKSVFIKGKTYEYLDSTKLWENSTNEKRDLIKTVFGISDNLINNTNKIETLILTQPFQEDCGLTDDEMYEYMKKHTEELDEDTEKEVSKVFTKLNSSNEDIDIELDSVLNNYDIDLIVLVGYLKLIGKRLIDKYPQSTICMFNIINIEAINKKFGRNVGTKIIVYISNIVKSAISSQYIFVRYMGPKFAIAFSGVDIEGVEDFAKTLKKQIENIQEKIEINSNKTKKQKIIVSPKTNFVLATYCKGTGIEEVTKKLEEYLDDTDKTESNINCI